MSLKYLIIGTLPKIVWDENRFNGNIRFELKLQKKHFIILQYDSFNIHN